MVRILIVFVCIIFLVSDGWSETTVPGGNISGKWTIANSPYLIEGEITIPNDSTLMIDPGVIVEFQGHYALEVRGRLLAVGTASDTILFTVNDTSGFSNPDTTLGGWFGIRFTDTPLTNDSSKIHYCKLQYGKTVAPAYAGGALCVLNFDKLTVSNCRFQHNMAGGRELHVPSAGAVFLAGSDVRCSETIFTHNRAFSGGAVQYQESDPVFIKCIFSSNRAIIAGAVSAGGNCNSTFINCTFINNQAEEHGGGIRFWVQSYHTLDNVTFTGNQAGSGGDIWASYCELQIQNSTFTDNATTDIGGGISADNCTLHLVNNTFRNNSAKWGGGIHANNGDLKIDSCLFANNRTIEGDGGGIDYRADSTIFGAAYQVEITQTRFIGNTAIGNSGGARIEQGDSDISLIDIVIDRCEFRRNHADITGPFRIAGNISEFVVSNSIFAGNTSTRWAAGAGFISGVTGKVTNCIFTSNYSTFSDSTALSSQVTLSTEARVDFFNCTFNDTSTAGGYGLSLRRGCVATITNSILWGCGDHPISITTAAGLGATAYVNFCDIENGIDSIFVSDSLSSLHWGEETWLSIQNLSM